MSQELNDTKELLFVLLGMIMLWWGGGLLKSLYDRDAY